MVIGERNSPLLVSEYIPTSQSSTIGLTAEWGNAIPVVYVDRSKSVFLLSLHCVTGGIFQTDERFHFDSNPHDLSIFQRMIIVREAMPEDREAVETVVTSAMVVLRRIYRPGPKAMAAKSGIASELKRLVALVDGELVGTTQYYEEGDAICVLGWMVRQDWQRKGVGRALIIRLTEIARKADRRRLLARTIKETGNVQVFQKLGFVVVAEQPDTLFVSELYSCLTEVELELNLEPYPFQQPW